MASQTMYAGKWEEQLIVLHFQIYIYINVFVKYTVGFSVNLKILSLLWLRLCSKEVPKKISVAKLADAIYDNSKNHNWRFKKIVLFINHKR